MTINAVIFDIGHVLVEWHPERPFDRLLGRTRREDLFARVDFENMNIRCDLGADIRDEVRALAASHPEDAADIMIWHDHWMEMLAPDHSWSARLLRALRARGTPIHALSNFGSVTLEWAERRYPVLSEFDRRFISGHLGMIKPDPALYGHVEDALDLTPDSLFFIDDRPENVAAANARGWQTHLFETPARLADRLCAEDLLTVEECAA